MNNLENAFAEVSTIGQYSRRYFSYLAEVLESVDEIEIYGTKGSLLCRPLNSGNLVLHTKGKSQPMNQPPLKYTHVGLVEDFVNHLRKGTPICCTGQEGLKTNRIIAEIYANSRQVKVDA